MNVSATVLAYHAIGDCAASNDHHLLFVSPRAFEAQMEFLSKYRRVVTLQDLVEGSLSPGKPVVAITFDDGYRVVFEHALPILERFGFPASIFVPTRFVGDRNRWDEPSSCPLEIMTAEELRSGDARGLSVESHGHAHINLLTASVGEAHRDLSRSVRLLTEIAARPPRFLAYPFSAGSLAAQDVAADLGFLAAFNIKGRDEGPFARARVPIGRLDPPWLFRLQTSGRYPGLRYSATTEWALGLARKVRGGPRQSTSEW